MTIKDSINSIITVGGKAALSLLPNPISAILNGIWDELKNNVFKTRYEEFEKMVVDRLYKLEDSYEELVNDENFATALLKTSRMAFETELSEKREILANALVNSFTNKLEEDKMIIFLHLIEKYTCSHIRVLKYFNDEFDKTKFNFPPNPPIMVVIMMNLNDIEHSYLRKIINDLQNDYLINKFKEESVANLFKKDDLVTELGKEFYNFIKDTSRKSAE